MLGYLLLYQQCLSWGTSCKIVYCWVTMVTGKTTCSLKKAYNILKIQIFKKITVWCNFFLITAWAKILSVRMRMTQAYHRSKWKEGAEKKRAKHGQKGQQPGRFFLDRKQRWAVVMRINNWSHKTSIKKLYKITKITALLNPVANNMGIARIFRLFLATAREFASWKESNQLHLRKKDKKKYGRIKYK